MSERFLTLNQVSEELNTSMAQCYALVRSGALRAIKIGGRGQWRVGRDDLDLNAYVEQAYRDTREFIQSHPWQAGANDEE